MTASGMLIETLARHDRLVTAGGLLAVAGAGWAYLLAGAGMDHAALMMPMPWTPGHAAMMFLMWWAMMAAMMLPSAAPMILLVAAVHRRRQPGRPDAAVAMVAAGYLAVWGAFSLAATSAQWGLERVGFVTPGTMRAVPALAGAILLGAGLYQLTPLKQACLRHCRSPVAFVTVHWRQGSSGAFRLGILHGGFCLGCCWFLMALLFVGGVMNPFWVGAIALYVLAEKLLPQGRLMSRVSGGVLATAGVAVLAMTG